MADGGIAAGVIIAVVLIVVVPIYYAIQVVREKEAIVVERLGKFVGVKTPGCHCLTPCIECPRSYSVRYFITNARGQLELVDKMNQTRVSMRNEVLDFPKQQVITRDNAMVSLDALLNYKVVNPQVMLYNTQNLPRMMSKVLQAQLRNVAGSLDVDQLIESTAGLNRVGAEMKRISTRWGVHVEFVKVQKVDAGGLSSDLEKKKNADLKNKQVLISAKAEKQTAVINAEGQRDKMMREAEGDAQAIRSRARGDAKAIVNQAQAEAESVKEIARAIRRSGENPTKYLLALKYISVLREIVSRPNTTVKVLPRETAFLQASQALGLSTIHPGGAARRA